MRMLHLSAGAAAILMALAVQAVAQEAGDCDMICRLKGYLSTDHMAADAAGDAPAAAPSKARRPRAAAVHKPAPAAAKPVATAARPAASVPPAASRAPLPEARTVAKTPAKRDVVAGRPAAAPLRAAVVVPAVPARTPKPMPVEPVAARAVAAAIKAPKVPTRPASPKAPAAAVAAGPARVALERRHAARARLASAPTRTASLATAIPGSAPAMQAGFH